MKPRGLNLLPANERVFFILGEEMIFGSVCSGIPIFSRL